jgi:polynucleotide 5'-hydroxyl-kinase GRC3/NOL9
MVKSVIVPPDWEQLDFSEPKGTWMVVGASDVGKSTLAQYLFTRLVQKEQQVAILDGDPGQSTLGPPSMMTLAVSQDQGGNFPPDGRRKHYFIGAVSPKGHMLPTLVGAALLVKAAQRDGARVIIYDTTGLTDPSQGGLALKWSKIELLRPTVIFAIQREDEIETLLTPLRRNQRIRLVELRSSPHTRKRDTSTRQSHRARKFKHHFTNASHLTLNWANLPVYPKPNFARHQVVALEDEHSFTQKLGIVLNINRDGQQIILLTPLKSRGKISALRLGNLKLDPHTFRDERLETSKW